MPNIQLSGQTILVAVAVVVIIAEAISAIAKGRKSWREVSGQEQREVEMKAVKERLKDVETRVKTCEDRLDKGDAKFDEIRSDLRHILDTQNATLMHFISGNDKENLKKVKTNLDAYLASK